MKVLEIQPGEKCPGCGAEAQFDTINTRIHVGGFRYRRKECRQCKYRWNTCEIMEPENGKNIPINEKTYRFVIDNNGIALQCIENEELIKLHEF